jgi:glycosyltransferase involved in cell wall biosynthesis
MNSSVSVGIPTFNRAGLLRQAIQSILQQTFQDFEIIVSDDCSTDDTEVVVASYHDPRIRYQRTATNLQPPRNWNACVRLAQSEFFALLPDDDVYCPQFLETMIAALRDHPDVAFVQCGYSSVDEQLRPLATIQAHSASLMLRGEQALLWHLEHLSCIPASVVFRRAAMLQMGLWREDYWDDWAFILRTAYRFGFVFVPQVLSANRIHGQNLNQVLYREKRDAILDLINQQADVFGTALPVSPALLALRDKLNRQLSHHCVLLALGALRRRDWRTARVHFTRARQLNALAGVDPGFIRLWLTMCVDIRRTREQYKAAQSNAPILQFETLP